MAPDLWTAALQEQLEERAKTDPLLKAVVAHLGHLEEELGDLQRQLDEQEAGELMDLREERAHRRLMAGYDASRVRELWPSRLLGGDGLIDSDVFRRWIGADGHTIALREDVEESPRDRNGDGPWVDPDPDPEANSVGRS